jgi:hypothetical protein
VLEIHEKWGADYPNPFICFLMGNICHKLEKHKKEVKNLELGRMP